VGRLGAVNRRLTKTTVWLLEGPGASLNLHYLVHDPIAMIRLDLRGPQLGLTAGEKVRVSGMALPLGPVSVRMASPTIETIGSRGTVVILRSHPCETCGPDGARILDWMGVRGRGFLLTGPKTCVTCPDCEGVGVQFFEGPDLFALSRWTAGCRRRVKTEHFSPVEI
jgi:hypothetical protein